MKQRILFSLLSLVIGVALVAGSCVIPQASGEAPASPAEPSPDISSAQGYTKKPAEPSLYEKPARPASVMSVIFLSGTSYEMGYQYGHQRAKEINTDLYEVWATALSGRTYDTVITRLKEFQYYIKKYTPEMIDQFIGTAVGATEAGYDVSYNDILLLHAVRDFRSCETPESTPPSPLDELPPKEYQQKYPRQKLSYMASTGPSPLKAASPNEPESERCSRWAAWGSATKDGKLVCGQSLDSGGAVVRPAVYIAFPDEGNAYIAQSPWAGKALLPYMNNKGLFVAGGALQAPRDIDRDYGLPPTCALPHLARFTDNANDAKELLLSWQTPGGRSHNFMLADTSGNAFVFEVSAVLKTFREAGDFGETDWIAGANTFVIPANCALYDPPLEPFENDYRIRHMWEFFGKYAGHIDPEFGKMIYRYQDPGGTMTIGRRSNFQVFVAVPDDGDKGYWYQCLGSAAKSVTYGTPNALADGLYAFSKLELKSSPKGVVEAAQKASKKALSKADLVLRQFELSPQTLASYLALREWFSEANDEWFEGYFNKRRAMVLTGNEAIYLYSKAIGAFTSSETKFNAICNLFEPPPTTPEDLGLEPLSP